MPIELVITTPNNPVIMGSVPGPQAPALLKTPYQIVGLVPMI